MAVTVTPNVTSIDTADSSALWLDGNDTSGLALDTSIKIQGTGSVVSRVNGTTIASGLMHGPSAGSIDLSNTHIIIWGMTMQKVDTFVNGGWRIRVSLTSGGLSNYGEWTVAGNDLGQVGHRLNYTNFVVDTNRSFDFVSGIPPALNAVVSVGLTCSFLTSNGRLSFFVDDLKHGSGLAITGGTSINPGTFIELATDDNTFGRGIIKKTGGIFYVMGKFVIGDITNVDSYFSDSNKVVLFEEYPVKNNFHKLSFVGHATPVNVVTFGSQIGTGITAVGVGGNTFMTGSPTSSPFSLEAIDANIVTQFLGTTFINSLYNDHSVYSWSEDVSPLTETDNTRAWNVAVGASLFPAIPAASDNFGVMDINRGFYGIEVVLGILGVGSPVLAFEYWDGTAWTSFSGLVDGTNGFTQSGKITWAKPNQTDWGTGVRNSLTGRLARIRIVSGTFSVVPVANKVHPIHAGGFLLENANVKAISCIFSGCGVISIRNGAILRKSTITDSNAGKIGALDLGSIDPVTDSVRDLNIQNSTTGILLKGTATGTTTYNIRNFAFAGNTNDFRIDFPAAATIVINLIEGTKSDTALITSNQDNVNGSTINMVVSPVTISIHVEDSSGVSLQNSSVLVMASDNTGDLPFNDVVTITRIGSIATVLHTAHGMINGDIVVIGKQVNQVQYSGAHVISNVATNSYDYTVSGTPITPATGLITVSGGFIDGVTDINGDISVSRVVTLNTPIKGFVRKSSVQPRFKTFNLSGNTVNSTNGLTVNIRMISDE